jgi:hypothetical protein
MGKGLLGICSRGGQKLSIMAEFCVWRKLYKEILMALGGLHFGETLSYEVRVNNMLSFSSSLTEYTLYSFYKVR